VTSKDNNSVEAILGGLAADLPIREVFGGLTTKLAALRDISRQEGVAPQEVWFFDDNVRNVLEALQAGHTAHWANWGQRPPPDAWETARSHRIVSIGEHEFRQILAHPPQPRNPVSLAG
jgi:hypothetical protein